MTAARETVAGRIAILLVLSAVFGLLAPVPASAQMSSEELRRERQEILDELRRTERDFSGKSNGLWRGLSRVTGWGFNYGGWYSPSFVASNENDRNSAQQDVLDHSWENDLRFFFLGRSATGKSTLYIRFGSRLTNNSRISESIKRSDWVQGAVDMFYFQTSMGSSRVSNKFVFGRQFVKVKNSLAFGMVADGVDYEIKTRRQSAQAFFLVQREGDDQVDFLAPNPGRSRRWFYGTEYTLKLIGQQNINTFAIGNIDRNSDKPDAEGQKHGFDSRYFGFTLFGMLFSRLEYEAQYIKQLGRTYSDSGNLPAEAVDMDGHAIYAGLKYYFSGGMGVVIHSDYLFASGDGDATGNVFSTSGGSGSLIGSGNGGKDRRFIPFGGKNLGYALAPTPTNLHTVKAGFSLKPFGWSESRLWESLKVHPQYYLYRRDESTGAISDPYVIRSATASNNVGHEIDVSVAWRVMSDVNYQFKWGRFMPGPAYATRSPETFFRFKMSLDL